MASCVRVVLRGGRQPIELPREAASRKGMFRRESFWDVVMTIAAAKESAYVGYSYREKCDRFLRELTHAEAERIRIASDAVRFSTLREQIRNSGFGQMELFVVR
jgi:phosphatidylserine/phosphatidylglycerophosphate/cardiolipin synthase-like enzyme